MKKFLKSYCVGFIISVLLCGSVYAATYFASSDVTYDNTVSGLSSTDVQGAIDELYTDCTTTPAGEQIIEDAGLEKDPYECRYFFTGANPNNYVTFNGENAGWRIISVECDGRIKIMKKEKIDSIKWDDTNSDWTRPATLNTYLNETYYNSLNSNAKTKIALSNFSIGSVETGNDNMSIQVNNENSSTWEGNIALPTLSEYLRTNGDRSNCGTFKLNNDNRSSCANTGWMDDSASGTMNGWWTITSEMGTSSFVFTTYAGSIIMSSGIGYSDWVCPALYLSSDIKITGGTGTSSDPYQISL